MKKLKKGEDLEKFEKTWEEKYTAERKTRMEKQKKKQAAAADKEKNWLTNLKELVFQSKGGKKNDESANNNAAETKQYSTSEALTYGETKVPFSPLVAIQGQWWFGKTKDERAAVVERLTPLTSGNKVIVNNVGTAG
jgi:hypothetical protein